VFVGGIYRWHGKGGPADGNRSDRASPRPQRRSRHNRTRAPDEPGMGHLDRGRSLRCRRSAHHARHLDGAGVARSTAHDRPECEPGPGRRWRMARGGLALRHYGRGVFSLVERGRVTYRRLAVAREHPGHPRTRRSSRRYRRLARWLFCNPRLSAENTLSGEALCGAGYPICYYGIYLDSDGVASYDDFWYTGDESYSYMGHWLTRTYFPEPSTGCLLALGLLTLAMRREVGVARRRPDRTRTPRP
jgi:hypothetical protein